MQDARLKPFPLVENPSFASVAEIDYLRDDDLVFICKTGQEIRLFSQRDMLVEVVNTEVNGLAMAVTYSPITRSGIAWRDLFEHVQVFEL